MRTFSTLIAAAMFGLGVGYATTAQADAWADSVHSIFIPAEADVTGDNADGGADALGAANGAAANNTTFTSIGWEETDTPSGGILILDFDNNVCLNGANPDFTVFEVGAGEGGANEPYNVSVGLQGGGLSSAGSGVGDTDLNSPVAAFNRISITATGNLTDTTSGPDIDAVQCLYSLDQADIEKAFVDNPQDGGAMDEIDVIQKGDFTIQYKAFTIKITNDTGIDNAFVGLTFFDAVPAEYDLDPEGEDRADGTDDNTCDDGVCDGIAEDLNGKCVVTESRPNGATHGKNAGNKLEPELLSINAGGLLGTEMCTTTVYVMTEVGHKKSTTPTSCPVDLNSGVKVFDALKNLLLQDDDKLIFDAGAGTDGTCNPA